MLNISKNTVYTFVHVYKSSTIWVVTQTMRFSKNVVYSFMNLCKCATIKDPCKKCLVKVCCKNNCKSKDYIVALIQPYESIIVARLHAQIILASFIYWIICAIYNLYNYL